MNKILFLCTGNYYRSRFSEEYFNHFSKHQNLTWFADSKGLQRSFVGNGNIGPIAQNTLNKLSSLNINPVAHARMPSHVYESDFQSFDRVIAVSKDEHEPMLSAIWPETVFEKVEYFDVEDLHIEGPETALPRLIRHLDKLIYEIAEQ